MTTRTQTKPDATPPAGAGRSIPPRPAPATPAPDAESGRWFRREGGESPLECDRRWLGTVYRGDLPQLTSRAVLTGVVLGSVLAISNLYVGLKAGWALSVAITACVMSAAFWRTLHRAGGTDTSMSVLEQNCMQSTASAAGFATSAALVTAVPAYMLVTGLRLEPIWLVLWTFFTSMLGLALAVPVKRQLLHYEGLAWPSSVAAAQTLRTLHEKGERIVSQARWLFASATVAAAVRWAIDNAFAWWKLPAWPETLHVPGRLQGSPLSAYNVGIDASTLYFAAGAILGPRVSAWMLAGSAMVWLGVAPQLVASGRLDEPSWGGVMLSFALWAGAALMTTASLTGLAMEWRVLLRGVGGLRRERKSQDEIDPLRDIEIPLSWSLLVAGVSGAGVLLVGELAFGIHWTWSLVGIALSVAAAGVAIRATGETDIVPAGSLGKLTQLGFGAAAPRSLAANLLGTSIVTTSASAAVDVSINLKCGHLLGAQPRKQFLAQTFGVLAGTAVVVPAFALLVPDISVLGSEALPAPAAQSWRVVAELVRGGFSSLDGLARMGMIVGGTLGVLLAIGEEKLPRLAKYWPSAVGLGVGMVLPLSEALAFFAGSMVAAFWKRWRNSARGEDEVIAVSSGCIAGDSLMGVLLALLVAARIMPA